MQGSRGARLEGRAGVGMQWLREREREAINVTTLQEYLEYQQWSKSIKNDTERVSECIHAVVEPQIHILANLSNSLSLLHFWILSRSF